MKYLIRLDRFAAWILFICLLLYFISGYGMTKGIISLGFSTKLHLNYLTYIILVAFICHTSFAIHLAFKRWHFWHKPGKTILVLFYLFFISFFVWVDRFYVKKPLSVINENLNLNTNANINNAVNNNREEDDEDTVANTNTAAVNPVNINTSTNAQPALKTFTSSELAQNNGQNGRPSYVAVDGLVYDVTGIFVTGRHFYHLAGQNLTAEFHSQHAKSSITKYPIVGKLI